MKLSLTLVVSTLFAVTTSLKNVPGCLPDEEATIMSQSIFPVPNLLVPGDDELTNVTMTFFKCPSREAPGVSPPSTPIDLCGLIGNSEVFFPGTAGTFNCTQGPGNQPTLDDCEIIDRALADSFARTAEVAIPPRSGAILSLLNDTCVFVFLNDDDSDTYSTCVGATAEMNFFTAEEACFGIAQDGFLGSYRSPVQPGVQNWEWHIAYAPDLDFDVGS